MKVTFETPICLKNITGAEATVICRVPTNQTSDPREETKGNHTLYRETGGPQAAETVDEI